jgi:hypothetical protein
MQLFDSKTERQVSILVSTTNGLLNGILYGGLWGIATIGSDSLVRAFHRTNCGEKLLGRIENDLNIEWNEKMKYNFKHNLK